MRIVVLPGDGIGPEIAAVTSAVLRAASERFQLGITLEEHAVGHASLEQSGTTVRPELLDIVRSADGLILGPTATFDFKDEARGEINPSRYFRKNLDLFANVRPARTYPGRPTRFGAFDLVVVRENTEGFYADRNMEQGNAELLVTPDVVVSLRRITRRCCERIAHAACSLAMKRRKHLAIVHKANVLKIGDGMFLKVCQDVAHGYAGLAVDDVLVDAMMAHVVRQPERFDVIVATNMFGDILSVRRAFGKPRAWRLAQCGRPICDGSGRARLGARYRRTRCRQSDLADPVDGAAAIPAWRTCRRRALRIRRARDRRRCRRAKHPQGE